MSLKSQIFRLPGAITLWHKLRPLPDASDYHKPIRTAEGTNDLIHTALTSREPFVVARLDRTTLECVRHYMAGRRARDRAVPYPASVVWSMETQGGFFGATNESLDHFAKEYLGALKHVDAIAVFFNRGENDVIREYCPEAEVIMLPDIEPYYHPNPWSRAMSGRRVLVIHPFAESIKENYQINRERLFSDPGVLPSFDLRVIKAVQSVAGEPTEFASWFDALEHMKREMDATTFDVCIVGAGNYGLLLAVHAKRSGLQGIHMGGATQILFGIKGRRWDEHEVISKLYNECWTRPKPSEVPRDFQKVDRGAYW